MKRVGNHINRNTTNVFNHIRNNISRNNVVTPEILVNQIWMPDDETNGVKIIELNSSPDSPKESPVNNFNHAWSFVNNDQYKEDNYRINEEARRRRRMKCNENAFAQAYYANEYYMDHNKTETTEGNGFYETYDRGVDTPVNHQMNCFTIIHNQNNNTDSSSDENDDAIEIIEIDNNAEEQAFWDHVYNEEDITYDQNNQSEKRTIWIYSYKNKRILSDNDFELVNIPSKDTTSTSSFSISDDEKKSDKSTNVRRIGSPIPATYIPRLDLSLVQTLSTVTELSEPNKYHSNESSSEKINLKLKNNWLTYRNDKVNTEQHSNVVNWMALSPRERRRRSINTNFDISREKLLKTENTCVEGIGQSEQINIKSGKIISSTVQVQVDIHVNENEISKELKTPKNENGTVREVKNIASILPIKISFADADIDVDNEITDDEFVYSNKPHIQLDTKTPRTEISDPIEKLDSNNWINEEKVETETIVYDYDLDSTGEVPVKDISTEDNETNSANRRLWKRNLQLMKPSEWTEYLPITGSPSSLHLSLSLSSIEDKKSWFKRVLRIFKCCK